MRFVWLIPMPKFNLNNSRRFCTGCKWTWQLINNTLLPLKPGGKFYKLVYESKATKKKKEPSFYSEASRLGDLENEYER